MDSGYRVLLVGAAWLAMLGPAGAVEVKPQVLANADAQLKEAQRLNGEGMKLDREGKSKQGLALVQQALAIRTKILGPKHEVTLSSMNNVGSLHLSSGDATSALPIFEEALRLTTELRGKQHADTAEALLNLGSAQQTLGNFKAALINYRQALEIREKLFGRRHAATLEALNSVGFGLQAAGDYAGAVVYFEDAVNLGREVQGKKDLGFATSLNNLGFVMQELGNLAKARPLYEEALAVRKEVAGAKHPITALSMNNLAGLLRRMGDFTAARRLYEEALAARKELLGNKHPDTAASLNNLGTMMVDLKDYEAAQSFYQQAFTINREVYGDDHPLTAVSGTNIAFSFFQQGKLDESRAWYRTALQVHEKTLGAEHPTTASTRNNLAMTYQADNNDAEAQPLLEKSLSSLSQSFGERHPRTVNAHANLANVLARQKKYKEAAAHFDRSRRGAHHYVRSVLPALTEKEQLAFLKHADREYLEMAISFVQARRDFPGTTALAASWVLNGKSVAQESLVQQSLLRRSLNDESLKEAAEAVANARRQLAALANRVPRAGEETDHRKQLAALEASEEELSRNLLQKTGHTSLSARWVELSQLAKSLPRGTALVEYFRIRPYDFSSKDPTKRILEERYYSWLMTEDSIGFQDLGPAKQIDDAIAAARTAIESSIGVIKSEGEVDAEKLVRDAMNKLATIIIKPLLTAKAMENTQELILSPDGQLWLVPWQALPIPDGGYLVERFRIRHVVSGRDLVNSDSSRPSSGKAQVFADPDYDLSAAEVAVATQQAIKAKPDQLTMRTVKLRTGSALPRVARLPGTAAEAEAIAPSIERLTSGPPLVHSGRSALEGVVKRLQAPRVLVLSTHGYFLADEQVPRMDLASSTGDSFNRPVLNSDNRPLENPLLRCGLLLAGCNQLNSDISNLDDGVLTGLETASIDLRNTELVVLSACETGLGKVRNGEGVAGLRQAFQLAGAKSVVSTLWQIPDKQSTQLMTDFFGNLANGEGKSEALRNAQLAMIKARRERNEAAHPLFWAAWTVTGN